MEKTQLPRLLVIDDEVAILNLVQAMLSRAHYEVITCTSAEEGLAHIEQSHFDCVITDAIMPAMSGYEFVKTLRKHPLLGKLPVLMLSRKRHRHDVKKAVEAGVTDYVLKPIDEQLFLDKIELCLNKHGSRRPVQEQAVSDHENVWDAQISFDCKVLSVTESVLILRLPIALDEKLPFHLNSTIFEKIGITPPLFRLRHCIRVAADHLTFSDECYEAQLEFVNLPPLDLAQIHRWLFQRETERRK